MSVILSQPVHSPAPPVHHTVLPHWLTQLGPLGLFAIAIVDSSPIPLPIPGSTDLLLLWLVAHKGVPWLLVLCAIAGSILGGYTCWHIGHKGGEAALHRHVNARLLRRINFWFEHHPILSVFLPAILPPPIPLSPFLLAAGALGVPRNRFLLVYGVARTLRYSFIAWLGVTYGRHVIRMWSGTIQAWSAPLLWIFGAVVLGGICYGVWKYRSQSKTGGGKRRELKGATTRVG
jgi:membrane protein YqaA with SNARE-associated domain